MTSALNAEICSSENNIYFYYSTNKLSPFRPEEKKSAFRIKLSFRSNQKKITSYFLFFYA